MAKQPTPGRAESVLLRSVNGGCRGDGAVEKGSREYSRSEQPDDLNRIFFRMGFGFTFLYEYSTPIGKHGFECCC